MMVSEPVAVAGIVMEVLKAPDAADLNEKVADPAMTVPVVDALKPVPLTVTADPAGPVLGLREIWAATGAAGAAWAGWTAAKVSPSPTKRPVISVPTVLSKAIPAIGWWLRGHRSVRCRQALVPILERMRASPIKIGANFSGNRIPQLREPYCKRGKIYVRTRYPSCARQKEGVSNGWTGWRKPAVR